MYREEKEIGMMELLVQAGVKVDVDVEMKRSQSEVGSQIILDLNSILILNLTFTLPHSRHDDSSTQAPKARTIPP